MAIKEVKIRLVTSPSGRYGAKVVDGKVTELSLPYTGYGASSLTAKDIKEYIDFLGEVIEAIGLALKTE